MAIEYKLSRFSKPGKGFPQVEQLDDDGKPILKDGKPVIGNEQYQCNQLTDESISSEDVKAFVTDVLASVEGDLSKAADMFREGWNRVTRLSSAGLDEYQKAARMIIKAATVPGSGFKWAKGLSLDEVAEKLKAMNG